MKTLVLAAALLLGVVSMKAQADSGMLLKSFNTVRHTDNGVELESKLNYTIKFNFGSDNEIRIIGEDGKKFHFYQDSEWTSTTSDDGLTYLRAIYYDKDGEYMIVKSEEGAEYEFFGIYLTNDDYFFFDNTK